LLNRCLNAGDFDLTVAQRQVAYLACGFNSVEYLRGLNTPNLTNGLNPGNGNFSLRERLGNSAGCLNTRQLIGGFNGNVANLAGGFNARYFLGVRDITNLARGFNASEVDGNLRGDIPNG